MNIINIKQTTTSSALYGYFLQYFKYTGESYSQEVYAFVCVHQLMYSFLNSKLS